MKILYFVLVAAGFAVSNTATAEPKSQYGGYSLDDNLQNSLQAYLAYVNSLEVINVKASAELQQAIAAIPVEADVPITPEQEAELRTWLYDFLIAFSASGSDSLAAAFYLREGTNNPERIERLKKYLESEGALKDETPFALFQAGHRQYLDENGCTYYFGKVAFFGSAFKVAEMQAKAGYTPYFKSLMSHSMIPPVGASGQTSTMKFEVEEHLQAGQSQTFVEVMFIVEEPEEFAAFEGPTRIPFFFRLAWDPDKAMWCHVESVYGTRMSYFLFRYM